MSFSCLSLFSSLDPEQKDYLIEVIEKLLKDKTTVKNFDCLCATILLIVYRVIVTSWQFYLPVLPESRVLLLFNRYDLLKFSDHFLFNVIFECVVFMANNNNNNMLQSSVIRLHKLYHIGMCMSQLH